MFPLVEKQKIASTILHCPYCGCHTLNIDNVEYVLNDIKMYIVTDISEDTPNMFFTTYTNDNNIVGYYYSPQDIELYGPHFKYYCPDCKEQFVYDKLKIDGNIVYLITKELRYLEAYNDLIYETQVVPWIYNYNI